MDGQTSNERSQYKHIELDLSSSVLNDQEKQLFQEFINKNSDIFANDLSELGKCNIFKHTIKTVHEKPIHSQPYRTAPKAKAEIDKQVREMLEHDIIVESTSAYASPVVLVKKPNNEYRFAIDYRTLNAVMPIQTFLTVRLEDVFDAIGQIKAKLFFQP